METLKHRRIRKSRRRETGRSEVRVAKEKGEGSQSLDNGEEVLRKKSSKKSKI